MTAVVRLACTALVAAAIGSGATYFATRSTVTVQCPVAPSPAPDASWQHFTGGPAVPMNAGKGF
jgi:hypothetical protein